ncbi:MAG: FAD-binding oxidoreductase [Paraperlucidibaca sp.]|nr:FAD-binding oxidoreductase [Paraperlucidibaca sp.]
MRTKSAELSGWGRYPQVDATLARPEQYRELAAWAQQASLARGMGRAYGDAAISANGTTVLTERLDRLLSFDADTGVLRAEAGATLDTILRAVMAKGWFLPVTPGTRYITLGGAIAADVHGKNHHHVGSFGRFVRSFELFTAAGAMTCSSSQNVPAYQATLGGMGMTGLIGEVELQLKRIPSSNMLVQHVPAANLRESLALMSSTEHDDEYTVSWIDCLASGAKLGRSVFMRGQHADGAHAHGPRDAKLSLPINVPSAALNRYSVGAFNALYYRWEGRKTKPFRCDFEPFFYPLDGIKQWHRLYGKPGFVQYQFVVAEAAAEACIGDVLKAVSSSGNASFLAVLKRFGEAGAGLLSFPQAGMTLALDLPLRAGTLALLDRLDAIVVAHAGRVYLAKDARLNASMMSAMYPQLAEWQAIRRELDPDGLFVSALGQRLEMAP